MSHYRNLGGGKRDANEPQIMKRFAANRWHAEQISGNRLWDLLCFPQLQARLFTSVCLVDVKQADGAVTTAQKEKWSALAEKSIPVYVVRSEADVDALVRGELQPWAPSPPAEQKGKALATVSTDAGKRLHVVRETGKGTKRAPRPSYEAPRAHVCGKNGCRKHRPCELHDIVPALDVAQEADATFAPEPDAPDVTDTLGPGPHPEHYDCPCAPCVGRWNP